MRSSGPDAFFDFNFLPLELATIYACHCRLYCPLLSAPRDRQDFDMRRLTSNIVVQSALPIGAILHR